MKLYKLTDSLFQRKKMKEKTFMPLSFEEEKTGRFIKSTSSKYIWTFTLGNMTHRIELDITPLNGKRTVYLDGEQVYQERM